jgi:hypothetical protein
MLAASARTPRWSQTQSATSWAARPPSDSSNVTAADTGGCKSRALKQSLPQYELGMCVIVANTMERCSLFLPPRWGAGPMALMLWLNLVI